MGAAVGDAPDRSEGSSPPASAPADRAIRLLLANGHPLYRRGLRQLLELEDDLVVVAEAGTVATALALAEQLHPDVTLMDRHLPDGSGIAAVPELRRRSSQTGVLILAMFPEDDEALQVRRVGACAYLEKAGRAQQFIDAVRLAARLVPEVTVSAALPCPGPLASPTPPGPTGPHTAPVSDAALPSPAPGARET